jgi:hypothetical protein
MPAERREDAAGLHDVAQALSLDGPRLVGFAVRGVDGSRNCRRQPADELPLV